VSSASQPLRAGRALRIVQAARQSIATRGAAASTFDRVAQEAGVSRGLLHYYFGTKERLLAAVVRHECELRLDALESSLREARSSEEIIECLVSGLQELIRESPEYYTLVFELYVLSRRHPDIAEELAELLSRTREQTAAVLRIKQEEGVISPAVAVDAVADLLLALGDGVAMRLLAEPGRDVQATLEAGIVCVRALLEPGA
jgi:AcrR family transcriptional regulator